MFMYPSSKRLDRICYQFNYGDEWSFYAILNEVVEDDPDNRSSVVGKEKGEPVIQHLTDKDARYR